MSDVAISASRSQPSLDGPESQQQLVGLALKAGALVAKLIHSNTVKTGTWVRWKCQFGCGGFGSSLVCPPHSPTPEQTQRLLEEYDLAVLFEAPPGQAKDIAVRLEREIFLQGHYKALGLGAGPCQLCKKACAMEEGCRHPEDARPSMEACGIDVFATARHHGLPIEVVKNRQDEQHYYGIVLVE